MKTEKQIQADLVRARYDLNKHNEALIRAIKAKDWDAVTLRSCAINSCWCAIANLEWVLEK